MIIDRMESFSCSRDRVTINMIDNWTATATYTNPNSPINSFLLRPITPWTIILRNFNAEHEEWFNRRPTDESRSVSHERLLYDWSRKSHTVERGPRLPTRLRTRDSPSKLDLIWTRRDADSFIIGDYAPLTHNDHCILLARFRLIPPPAAHMNSRPDYNRMSQNIIRQFFESRPTLADPHQLDCLLNDSLTLIPRITRSPKHKLPPDIHATRSHLHHLMKRRWGSQQYRDARQQYHDSLPDFINNDMEDQLDTARDSDFF